MTGFLAHLPAEGDSPPRPVKVLVGKEQPAVVPAEVRGQPGVVPAEVSREGPSRGQRSARGGPSRGQPGGVPAEVSRGYALHCA